MTDSLNSLMQSLVTPGVGLLGMGSARMEFLIAVWAIGLVLCAIRINPVVWPLAIAGHLLNALLFWQYGLNGEALVQMLLVAMAVWGWFKWTQDRQRAAATIKVGSLGHRQRIDAAIDVVMLWLLLWPVLTFVLGQLTDSDQPGWDAFVSAGQVLAIWLLGRKLIEYWPVVIAGNAVTMWLLAFNGSWLVLPLYAVLIALALWGWRLWLQSSQLA